MSDTVIDIKTKKRRQHAPRDLVAIDKTSGSARYFNKMMRDIATDLGGRRNLSRIETEWIKGFCGCATRLEYLNYQIMLGEASDCEGLRQRERAAPAPAPGSGGRRRRRARARAAPGQSQRDV